MYTTVFDVKSVKAIETYNKLFCSNRPGKLVIVRCNNPYMFNLVYRGTVILSGGNDLEYVEEEFNSYLRCESFLSFLVSYLNAIDLRLEVSA